MSLSAKRIVQPIIDDVKTHENQDMFGDTNMRSCILENIVMMSQKAAHSARSEMEEVLRLRAAGTSLGASGGLGGRRRSRERRGRGRGSAKRKQWHNVGRAVVVNGSMFDALKAHERGPGRERRGRGQRGRGRGRRDGGQLAPKEKSSKSSDASATTASPEKVVLQGESGVEVQPALLDKKEAAIAGNLPLGAGEEDVKETPMQVSGQSLGLADRVSYFNSWVKWLFYGAVAFVREKGSLVAKNPISALTMTVSGFAFNHYRPAIIVPAWDAGWEWSGALVSGILTPVANILSGVPLLGGPLGYVAKGALIPSIAKLLGLIVAVILSMGAVVLVFWCLKILKNAVWDGTKVALSYAGVPARKLRDKAVSWWTGKAEEDIMEDLAKTRDLLPATDSSGHPATRTPSEDGVSPYLVDALPYSKLKRDAPGKSDLSLLGLPGTSDLKAGVEETEWGKEHYMGERVSGKTVAGIAGGLFVMPKLLQAFNEYVVPKIDGIVLNVLRHVPGQDNVDGRLAAVTHLLQEDKYKDLASDDKTDLFNMVGQITSSDKKGVLLDEDVKELVRNLAQTLKANSNISHHDISAYVKKLVDTASMSGKDSSGKLLSDDAVKEAAKYNFKMDLLGKARDDLAKTISDADASTPAKHAAIDAALGSLGDKDVVTKVTAELTAELPGHTSLFETGAELIHSLFGGGRSRPTRVARPMKQGGKKNNGRGPKYGRAGAGQFDFDPKHALDLLGSKDWARVLRETTEVTGEVGKDTNQLIDHVVGDVKQISKNLERFPTIFGQEHAAVAPVVVHDHDSGGALVPVALTALGVGGALGVVGPFGLRAVVGFLAADDSKNTVGPSRVQVRQWHEAAARAEEAAAARAAAATQAAATQAAATQAVLAADDSKNTVGTSRVQERWDADVAAANKAAAARQRKR